MDTIIEHSINKKYIPHFEYYPIVINRFSKQSLLKIKNVVSAVFLTENTQAEDFKDNIDELILLIRLFDVAYFYDCMAILRQGVALY